jgi:subtilisin family serine protease
MKTKTGLSVLISLLLVLTLWGAAFMGSAAYAVEISGGGADPERDAEFSLDTYSYGIASDENPDGYLSWGADFLGVGAYQDYLSNRFGLENLDESVVAVLDSGIDASHPLFDGRIASGGKSFLSYSPSAAEYADDNGHGTHVAGIICDLTPSNVKILPLKVINYAGSAPVSAIYDALEYVAQKKTEGINIVAANISISGHIASSSRWHDAYETVVKKLLELDVSVVVAAGNNGQNVEGYLFGNISSAVTVSSVENNNGKLSLAGSSNRGSYIDFAAPGAGITSAKNGGGYVVMSGTSMAAPHVSAVFALLSSNPDYAGQSARQLQALAAGQAIDIGASGKDTSFGYGLIGCGRVYSAYDAAEDGETEQNAYSGAEQDLAAAQSDKDGASGEPQTPVYPNTELSNKSATVPDSSAPDDKKLPFPLSVDSELFAIIAGAIIIALIAAIYFKNRRFSKR